MKKDRIYYRWFTTDWFGSRTRAALDPACRAVYRDFIDFCLDCGDTGYAQDHGKPLSLDDIALLLATPRQTDVEVKDCLCTLMDRGNVLACPEGYYNERALAEAEWRRIQTAAGRKGGEASGKIRSTTVQRPLNDRSTTVQRPFNDPSTIHMRAVSEPEPESETETEAETDQGTVVPLSPPSAGTARTQVPFAAIVDLYHKHMPGNPCVSKMTDKRKTALRARWTEDKDRQSLEWWERYFTAAAMSPFLVAGTDEGFRAHIDFLLRPSKMPRICEGFYRAKKKDLRDRINEIMGGGGSKAPVPTLFTIGGPDDESN